MSAGMKQADSIADLRKEFHGIPRIRVEFTKAISDLLAHHNISPSADLLGKLTLASADELAGQDCEVMGVWTN